MAATRRVPDAIALLVADVDGTLLTPEKTLTTNATAAVRQLSETGVGFTLVSSRPPRGLASLVATLDLRLPLATFNGGALVRPDLGVIKTYWLSSRAASATLDLLDRRDVEAWVFADGDWRLRNPDGPYVAANRRTVGFDPMIVQGFEDVIDRIDKIVGVSARPARLAKVEEEARRMLQGEATINLSNACYLDITHPEANKGRAVEAICGLLGIDLRQTAVIGDMTNDVAMFEIAGLAIAMGQAPDVVKASADIVTRSNAEEGFSRAVENLILPRTARRLAAS
jgi:Cof subfamily protein (haloacid dehalogenase superfamily)